jgi:site-specific DNA-methyltransferase (adenine-specific)
VKTWTSHDGRATLYLGDCIDVVPTLTEKVDAVITDPPYGLGFMGKAWDHGVPGVEFWSKIMDAAKPGAHLLAFGGTRTFHRMTCAIEDAGWEIRDVVMWVYGSGFPKSLDVSKAIDKAARGYPQGGSDPTSKNHGKYKTQATEGKRSNSDTGRQYGSGSQWTMAGEWLSVDGPHATLAAIEWEGWGTALKPAWEPIVMARKPLIGTVAANVLAHGTGGINIDACRVAGGPSSGGSVSGASALGQGSGWNKHENRTTEIDRSMSAGRWPANVVLDEEAGAMLDEQSGHLAPGASPPKKGLGTARVYGDADRVGVDKLCEQLDGGAARFFYCAKPTRAERDAGTHSLEPAQQDASRKDGDPGGDNPRNRGAKKRGNFHPTVKPVELMRWLVRLVTPPDGVVLDPFMGSGTTGIAASKERMRFVGIEREPDYFEIAKTRIDQESRQGMLL